MKFLFKLTFVLIFFSSIAAAVALTPKNISSYLNSHRLVLVEYWYPDCGYCKLLKPHLMAALRRVKGIKFATFNVDYDDNAVIRNRYNIEVTPTLVIYKNGVEISRQIGDLSTSEIVNWIKQNK